MENQFNLDSAIRRVPNFPHEGILFYDITSILINPEAMKYCLTSMLELYPQGTFDAVAAVEARGFIFGAPFAIEQGLPLIPIRKKGKLPGKTLSRSFALEYGEDEVEVHVDDVPQNSRILIVDDLAATGGTLAAAALLLKDAGASSLSVFCVIGLPFLGFKDALQSYPVTTLIDYDSE